MRHDFVAVPFAAGCELYDRSNLRKAIRKQRFSDENVHAAGEQVQVNAN